MYNVDRTCNSAGSITHSTELVIEFQGHCEKVTAEVTNLGKNPFILGFSWLQRHNPEIDWSKGMVKMTCCPRHCHMLQDKSTFIQEMEEEEYDNQYYVHETIRALDAQQESQKPREKTPEELVLVEYYRYLNVFSKKESERMPIRKPWDHAIDLKDTFKPKKGRIIPLSPQEQEEVTTFLDDQLKKGYIRPSKSPQTSPVFFVPKKDGKKRMVQDYQYLNEFTVKNNYPLLLIGQRVDKLQGTKLFMKMDLRWGYNNVWIKKGNEWKAAFVCFRGAFEPLVMYFRLCNFLATFQVMMNEIFTDMDDVVVVYIDDLMIFTKTDNQAEHDQIVLEVLHCLEENDLFVKAEKCTFRATEVDFLSMIVRRDGIKMDQTKVKAILDWPEPKKRKRSKKLPRSGKLLSKVHKRLRAHCTPATQPN